MTFPTTQNLKGRQSLIWIYLYFNVRPLLCSFPEFKKEICTEASIKTSQIKLSHFLIYIAPIDNKKLSCDTQHAQVQDHTLLGSIYLKLQTPNIPHTNKSQVAVTRKNCRLEGRNLEADPGLGGWPSALMRERERERDQWCV